MPRANFTPRVASLADEFASQFIEQNDGNYPQTDWWHGGARPNQLPPDKIDPNWFIWFLCAGRGFGKTRALAETGIELARSRPGSIGIIAGRTAGDTRDVLIKGDSGILRVSHPEFRPIYKPSQRVLEFPNGSIALVLSADNPEGFRGPQCNWALLDELAAWKYMQHAYDMLMMGVRLGERPRVVIGSTPKPYPLIKRLIADETVHKTTGSSYENYDNLSPNYIQHVIKPLENSDLGRQEIFANILTETQGALWRRDVIESGRVDESEEREYSRVVIAVDPSTTDNNESAETGIVVVGEAIESDGAKHYYILEDCSLAAAPSKWATRAVEAYHQHEADCLVAETNNGGDMVLETIRNVDKAVPVHKVHASRGKATRAEPISILYSSGFVHHVGLFAKLEDQMATWTPGLKSPDRLDALVWALSYLSGIMNGKAPNTGITIWDGRLISGAG